MLTSAPEPLIQIAVAGALFDFEEHIFVSPSALGKSGRWSNDATLQLNHGLPTPSVTEALKVSECNSRAGHQG